VKIQNSNLKSQNDNSKFKMLFPSYILPLPLGGGGVGGGGHFEFVCVQVLESKIWTVKFESFFILLL